MSYVHFKTLGTDNMRVIINKKANGDRICQVVTYFTDQIKESATFSNTDYMSFEFCVEQFNLSLYELENFGV